MIDESPGADRERCRSWPHMATIAIRNNFQGDEHLRWKMESIVSADGCQNEQKTLENPAKVSDAIKAEGGLDALGSRFRWKSGPGRWPSRPQMTAMRPNRSARRPQSNASQTDRAGIVID